MKEILIRIIEYGNAPETKIIDIFLEVTIKLRYKTIDFIDPVQRRSKFV